MNHLIVDTDATVVWDGAESTPVDIRNHLYFSFDFIATAALAEGESAAFQIQCAPPSEDDFCVPGEFEDIPEVVICGLPAEPAEFSTLVLNGPIEVGQRCKGTIPCACNGFLQVIPAEDEPGAVASFQVIALTKGPKR